MQVQQPLQPILHPVTPLASQALMSLTVGQQVDATVVKAALAAQVASIKVADAVLDIKTPIALQQGQTVQLEVSASDGKLVFKLLQSQQVLDRQSALSPQPGQQLTAEVLKVINSSRILVESKLQSVATSGALPRAQQIEIDISKINKAFTPGEKVSLDVVSTKPLLLSMKAIPLSKEEVISNSIKQLLSLHGGAKADLSLVSQAMKTLSLPTAVQKEIQTLINTVVDKAAINRPEALKQAIQHSGSFSEKQLLQQTTTLKHDFKVNVLKVLSRIETELARNYQTILQSGTGPQLAVNPTGQTPASAQQAVNLQALSRTLSAFNKGTTETGLLSGQTLGKSANTVVSGAATVNLLSGRISQPTASGQVTPDKLSPNSVTQQQNVLDKTASAIKVMSSSVAQTMTGSSSSQALQPILTPVSALVQASLSHSLSLPSITVLTTPPTAVSSPQLVLTQLLGSVLTSQSQALTVAKMLNQAVSSDKVRGLHLEFAVLQNLLKEVEGLHSRIQMNQLAMLKDPDTPSGPTASWVFDLPIKERQNIDFIQLQIEQHKGKQEDQQDDIWNMTLRLDTQNIGPIQATVTMQYENIKIIFRAENAEAAALLEQNLAQLHQAMVKHGLTISHVSCVCGKVAERVLTEHISEQKSRGIVDISV